MEAFWLGIGNLINSLFVTNLILLIILGKLGQIYKSLNR